MSRYIFSTCLPVLLISVSLFSCGSYRKNIMFRVPGSADVQQQVKDAESNYVIQPNDIIALYVYTNDGERLIDPDRYLSRDLSGGERAQSATPEPTYLVNNEGLVKLPMIGEVKLVGLTLRKAEDILQQAYSEFYEKPFVRLDFQNKRVVVLGAPGGQVIPLASNNVRLTEVLALAQGINNDANATNIRILRGNEVMVVDFSTFDGYSKGNMVMNPGDIIYVEPIRRPFAESVRDYAPVITIVSSLTTLVVVLIGL